MPEFREQSSDRAPSSPPVQTCSSFQTGWVCLPHLCLCFHSPSIPIGSPRARIMCTLNLCLLAWQSFSSSWDPAALGEAEIRLPRCFPLQFPTFTPALPGSPAAVTNEWERILWWSRAKCVQHKQPWVSAQLQPGRCGSSLAPHSRASKPLHAYANTYPCVDAWTGSEWTGGLGWQL